MISFPLSAKLMCYCQLCHWEFGFPRAELPQTTQTVIPWTQIGPGEQGKLDLELLCPSIWEFLLLILWTLQTKRQTGLFISCLFSEMAEKMAQAKGLRPTFNTVHLL